VRSLLLALILNLSLYCFPNTMAQEKVETVKEPIPLVTATSVKTGAKTAANTRRVNENVTLAAAQSFSNTTAITITDCPNPCPASGQAASLYPSPITVAGVVGPVQRVSVTLNGLSHAFPSDIDLLLVSPSGRKSVIMSDFGAGGAGALGISNIDVTLDDYAQRPVPFTVTGNTGNPFVAGSYRPSNSGTTDVFPAPAPAGPYTYTLSAFNGSNPNGTWNLYVIDDANLDGGSISGGWSISFDARPPAPTAGQILISEFRTRGEGTAPPTSDGAADEFIELYNNTDQSITIIDAIPGADPSVPGGAGWRFSVAQDAIETTGLILPQTVSTGGPLALPPRGYLLITTQPLTPSPAGNTYSLTGYPTGTGITASGASNVSLNPASPTTGFLPDNMGLAVFSTANPLTANRLDSVGYSSVTHPDYKEGTGLAPANGITTPGQHSWVRADNFGRPKDTGDNAADFVLVSTTGAFLDGVQATLGAPGPQRGPNANVYNTSGAPLQRNATIKAQLIDPQCAGFGATTSACARVRTADGANATNAAFGTLLIRRRFRNTTGAPIYNLRFRVSDITTLGNTTNAQADVRLLSSTARDVTNTAMETISLAALTLQQPPTQAVGGGVNSSVVAGTITTTVPLGAGNSIDLEFTLGVMRDGPFRFLINVEALPEPVASVPANSLSTLKTGITKAARSGKQ
jgi:subtilisin-like proprotein convertase family protein